MQRVADNMDIIYITKTNIAIIATHLADMGWAEANAGNISVLLPHDADADWDAKTVISEDLLEPFPDLAGRTLLITATWSRFRSMRENLDCDIVPVRISRDGLKLIRLKDTKLPTSELNAHLLVLASTVRKGWETATLVHTHSTNTLALSSSDLPSEMLEDALLKSHPEINQLLKRGIRFIEFMAPGSWELGVATADAFDECDCVVWRKHGILGLGRTIDMACDAVEVVEKAANILLLEKSAFGNFHGLKDRELELLPAKNENP